MLRVNEVFESVMGEGIMIGTPCTFIRLSGCNLFKYGGCNWCDTNYAQDPIDGIMMDEEQIVKKVEKYDHLWVTITGGEVLMQNIQPLLVKLRYNEAEGVGVLNDRRIQLETNCTLNPMKYALVTRVALSPKLGSSGMVKYMHYEYMEWLNPEDEVKFVIANGEDFDEAIRLLIMHPTKANVIFTPVNGINGKWIVIKLLRDKVKGVRVLPQLHKVFGLK